MTWQTIQGGGKKKKKEQSASYRVRQISAEVTFRRSPWRGATAGWTNSSFLELCRVLCLKKQNYQPVHKIHLFFPKKRPCKKNPVPPRSATCQICATDCWSRSYRVRLLRRRFSLEKSGYQAPPRKQKAQERERERGWRSVDAQRGSRSEKWDLHKKNYKMPTNASLWVAGVQDDASYLLLTVKDDFHRFIFYFFASGCTFKKKKKDVTHVFLHLISIFHPSMSQNECNVMIQVAAFWKYLTHFIF